MKCKYCGDNINLKVFGLPDDMCWGCTQLSEKDRVLKINLDQPHGHDDHAIVHAKK